MISEPDNNLTISIDGVPVDELTQGLTTFQITGTVFVKSRLFVYIFT